MKKDNKACDEARVSRPVDRRILLLRGHRVLLSSDLAVLYGVKTGVLNQAVKRNLDRFPDDFMFQLTQGEATNLVSQSVIPHIKHFGGTMPYAFTEQGVAMLSGILNSPKAVAVNIEIMRAFVKLRRFLETNEELARKLSNLESKYDRQFKAVFDAIREMMRPTPANTRKIGFKERD